MPTLELGARTVGDGHPTYFIADIAANHDGDLERAKHLIRLAAEAGAEAAKFQHFRAAEIVSDRGFRALGQQLSHQARWERSVFEVYAGASVPWEWTEALVRECRAARIEFFSAPYDLDAIDMLDAHMSVYKIGSGDITWTEALVRIASKGKPVLLSTGAADIGDVQRAVGSVRAINPQLVLLQCNTNYTGSSENFAHVHLNVLRTYRTMYPDLVLGLSDHTPGHAAVLGAVALGGRVVEKHFTDDTRRAGPDHPFSMDPASWREMVARTRELEAALGSPEKFVSGNETETVVLQRRAVRSARALPKGTVLTRADVSVLRPAPRDAIFAYELDRVIGQRLRVDVAEGEHLRWTMLESADRR